MNRPSVNPNENDIRMRNSRAGGSHSQPGDTPPSSPAQTDDRASRACCFCCLTVKNGTGKPDRSGTKVAEPVNEEPLTIEEIRSWAESFDKLMKKPTGRKVFREFLRSEYSEENMLFWLACEELKQESSSEGVEEKARLIYEDYISILSPKEVSLDSRVREVINRNMVDPTPHTFDEAQLQIYTLMHRDSYPRFLNSQIYKKLIQQYSWSRYIIYVYIDYENTTRLVACTAMGKFYVCYECSVVQMTDMMWRPLRWRQCCDSVVIYGHQCFRWKLEAVSCITRQSIAFSHLKLILWCHLLRKRAKSDAWFPRLQSSPIEDESGGVRYSLVWMATDTVFSLLGLDAMFQRSYENSVHDLLLMENHVKRLCYFTNMDNFLRTFLLVWQKEIYEFQFFVGRVYVVCVNFILPYLLFIIFKNQKQAKRE